MPTRAEQFVTVDVGKLKGLGGRLLQNRQELLQEAAGIMRTQLLAAVARAKQEAPTLTGTFAGAIDQHVEVQGNRVVGGIGTFNAPEQLPHFAVVEFGTKGPITAKKAWSSLTWVDLRGGGGSWSPPYMAIPLESTKFRIADIASHYASTFIAKSKSGNWLIFGKLGASQHRPRGTGSRRAAKQAGFKPEVIPLFVLRNEVPAREGTHVLSNAVDFVLPAIQTELLILYAAKLVGKD